MRVGIRHATPPSVLRWLRDFRSRLRAEPPVGDVDLGDLARITPIDATFGLGRGGKAVDRYYIEAFLERHAADVRGRVLEVADDAYTTRFGAEKVVHSDVLGIERDARVSVVANLCEPPDDLAWGSYDCIVFTQTLQFVADPSAALSTLARLLRSGGVLLATFPGISQISRYDADRWGDRWRLTTLAARELFQDEYWDASVEAFGSVLTAVGLLHGLVVEDLPLGLVDEHDPDYEVLVAARAVRR